MPRESTIGLDFLLEKPSSTYMQLVAPGITKGATTTLHVNASDPGWSGTPSYAPGQFVTITGSNWTTLDGKLHRITVVDDTGHTLTLDTDSSSETGPLNPTLSNIHVNSSGVNGWSHVCLVDFSVSPGTPTDIDVSTMCDRARVTVPGMSVPGTASFTGVFDLDDAGMQAMIDAYEDGIPRWFIGMTLRGQIFGFHGIVGAFSVGALGLEASIPFVGSFTLDATPVYKKALPEGGTMLFAPVPPEDEFKEAA